jgi:peptidoglycan/LPS O-acetylase OafA/YrhL
LRAVAVLLVVAFHAGLHVPGGFTGVDVFFAISGFVITSSLLLPELTTTGSIKLGRFYLRRARRLLPALAVMIVAVELLELIAGPMDSQYSTAHTGIAASVFAANVFLLQLGRGYFDVSSAFDPLLHTWTLAVEEQFYLIFPALLLLIWKLSPRRPQRTAITVLVAVSLVSFWLSIALTFGVAGLDVDRRLAFYGSGTRAWEFGCGALVAVLAGRLAAMGTRTATALGVGGLGVILAVAFATPSSSAFPGWRAVLPVAGSCAVLAAGIGRQPFSSGLLSTRPLVWIGDRSYSWYLWHFPVLVFARALFPNRPVALAAAALSLVPAALSYRYVETPFRSSNRLKNWRLAVLLPLCVLVPVSVAEAALALQPVLLRSAAVQRWEDHDRNYPDSNCESTVPLGARAGPRWAPCTLTVPHARGLIVLLGDSNASQFSGPVATAARAAGYDSTVGALEGCPFVDLRPLGTGVSGCGAYDAATLAAVLQLKPSLVVLANRDDLMMDSPSVGLGPPTGGKAVFGTVGKKRLWTQGLSRTLHAFSRAGIPVLLVRPVPLVPSIPRGCAVVRVLLGWCVGSVSRTEAARELRPAVLSENRAAHGTATVTFIDFAGRLCSTRLCRTSRGDAMLWRDDDHLTVAGAATLTKPFLAAIRQDAMPRLCHCRSRR